MSRTQRTSTGQVMRESAEARAGVSITHQPMTLSVRWAVSRVAISAARPDLIPPGVASLHDPDLVLMVIGQTDERGLVRLVRAHAWLHDPATGRKPVVESAPSLDGAHWLEDQERSLLHVDIPAWASMTVRMAADGPVLLYVRTTVLSRLGLEGGRYEMPELGGA